jgi:hypothetical protein
MNEIHFENIDPDDDIIEHNVVGSARAFNSFTDCHSTT